MREQVRMDERQVCGEGLDHVTGRKGGIKRSSKMLDALLYSSQWEIHTCVTIRDSRKKRGYDTILCYTFTDVTNLPQLLEFAEMETCCSWSTMVNSVSFIASLMSNLPILPQFPGGTAPKCTTPATHGTYTRADYTC